jgi:heavy metal translocating P-type ATPase
MGSEFCCSGCESAYSLLANKDLLAFYANQKGQKLAEGQQPLLHQQVPTSTQASFYVEGIHCLGCLWILEKLPEIFPGVKTSALNFSTHILRIEVSSLEIWPTALRFIRQLGYQPTLIENELSSGRMDHRAQLIRIGVTAFCTGNIMTLSASLYAGADSIWADFFPWLSLILFLPIFFFTAIPIYRAALTPLFFRRISVDLPVALAIFAGALLSTWNLVSGKHENYFDSLAMLVLLLLSSRFLLQQMKMKIGKDSRFLNFGEAEVKKISPQQEHCLASHLQIGDWIEVPAQKSVPVDSLLRSDVAYLNTALLTGESTPVKLRYGDAVDAGCIPFEPIKLEVREKVSNSRLAKILEQIQFYRMGKSPAIAYADALGKIFLYVVLALSAVLMLYFWNTPRIGLERSLALMIVTCPCVLAFAIPLSFTRALQIAGTKGILFKNPEKLESLARIRKLIFDKTGTITTGEFSVLSWENLEAGEKTFAIAYGLETHSHHPVAKAIQRYVRDQGISPLPMTAVLQRSDGVEGFYEGLHWSIHRLKDSPKVGENWVGLFRNQQLISTIHLGDQIRADFSVLEQLKKSGYSLSLLSGDRQENVDAMSKKFPFSACYAEVSPERKAEIVKTQNPVVMIGDGANDAIAFQAAEVGVAVAGAMDLSLKNADIVFTKPGLESLLDLFSLAKNTMSIVRQNFLFSVFYNFVAGSLAVLGWMTPLWAAILMPLSALTVFLHTYLRTERWK